LSQAQKGYPRITGPAYLLDLASGLLTLCVLDLMTPTTEMARSSGREPTQQFKAGFQTASGSSGQIVLFVRLFLVVLKVSASLLCSRRLLSEGRLARSWHLIMVSRVGLLFHRAFATRLSVT
jgi:hypothetical protein